MKVVALVLDDGSAMEPTAISYWDTSGADLQKLAVAPKTVIGFGRFEKGFLLVREETPGKIRVDTVE